MISILERAHLARKAGRVTRYHTQTLLRSEDVATHTFGLMNLLVVMTGGILRAELLMAALGHDMGEYATGDIPSPVKRAMSEEVRDNINFMEESAMLEIHYNAPMWKLSEWEQILLKAADNLDGLLKCIEEKRMGNYLIEEVGENYASYLDAQLSALGGGPAAELVQLALTEWHWSHK